MTLDIKIELIIAIALFLYACYIYGQVALIATEKQKFQFGTAVLLLIVDLVTLVVTLIIRA